MEILFDIWDERETSLFHSTNYNDIIEHVGNFPEAPLYSIGNEIVVNGSPRTIKRVHFGISESKPKIQVVVVVEGVG